MAPQVAMTPQLGQFLTQINGFLRVGNGKSLADFFHLEPFSEAYQAMAAELRQNFPNSAEEQLREKCTAILTIARDGLDDSPSWTQFILFTVQYLAYLRDVSDDQGKYLETYELLYGLQQKANSALTHPSLGHLMIDTVVSCARTMCRLGIGLDKSPELMTQLRQMSNVGHGADDGPKKTLPERAAELIRQALVTCLNDRNSGFDGNGRPEGKKRGIYKIANYCLKILWQCRKTRNASQIFTNIGNLSPPLSAYPKAERVTYLYYLGRFWFQNNHFYRALVALQHAYGECYAAEQGEHQRRQILIYLVTSSIIMGRLPSDAIFQRGEAKRLYQHFGPIIQAIKTGDLVLFRKHLHYHSPHADFFHHYRILLQLRNRCEVLVWRSLIRKVFIVHANFPPPDSRAGPSIDMNAFVTAFGYCYRMSINSEEASYTNPDFDGVDLGEPDDTELGLPTIRSIESLLMSLIDQGLLKGFILHSKQRLQLSVTKLARNEALTAGFPPPWSVIHQRAEHEKNPENDPRFDDVPGWRKAGIGAMNTGGIAGGTVIKLSNVRSVGGS